MGALAALSAAGPPRFRLARLGAYFQHFQHQLAAVSALRLVKLVVVEPYEISCEKVAVAQSAVALRGRPEGRPRSASFSSQG